MNKLFVISCSRGYYHKIQSLLMKLTLWPFKVNIYGNFGNPVMCRNNHWVGSSETAVLRFAVEVQGNTDKDVRF